MVKTGTQVVTRRRFTKVIANEEIGFDGGAVGVVEELSDRALRVRLVDRRPLVWDSEDVADVGPGELGFERLLRRHFVIPAELAEEAIDAAVKSIQDKLGVETGDFAAAHFSGRTGEQLEAILERYACAEAEIAGREEG